MTITRSLPSKNFTSNINSRIYRAILNNEIPYKTYITSAGDRLDHIAYKEYGDAMKWWVIAAASGIGWWLQMTDGIVLNIPEDLSDIEKLKDL